MYDNKIVSTILRLVELNVMYDFIFYIIFYIYLNYME